MDSSDTCASKRRRFINTTTPTDDTARYELYHERTLQLQSSLLTVGCRVRKAVPEGYKTTPTFTPRPFMHSRLSPELQQALAAPTTYSELTPYSADQSSGGCGMNVGGLLQSQPLATATFCGIGLHNMNQWASSASQDTTTTAIFTYPTNDKKRAFDSSSSPSTSPSNPSSDDDLDLDIAEPMTPLPASAFTPFAYLPTTYFAENGTAMTPHHRRGSSYPFKHTAMPDLMSVGTERKMAMPKSRRRAHQQQQCTAQGLSIYQENVDIRSRPPTPTPVTMNMVDNSNPFAAMMSCGMEEASFLRPREEVEMDCS